MDWIGEAANICYLVTAVAAIIGGGYMVARKIEKKLDLIESETKPNHGSSLRDAVDRIEDRLDRMDRELSVLTGQFTEHVRKNP